VRSFSTRRSTASSRFRSWLRSSWDTARSTGPALPITRRFWASVRAVDDSTSSTASTRVDDFCACWPPGPLERETLTSISESGSVTERVTRIDSRSMASILLDIDGVLHVSGEPIPGALEAVSTLRRAGHALRFVTNNSTRPRSQLAEELRGLGFELADDELQTTVGAAARELEGKRVLALVMPTVVPDLEAFELVGHDAEAVLIGGCDESLEPNQVFSYMNLARAFEELRSGAAFYCMHKNKWWQTSRGPMLDSGAFVAGLEYATGVEATVLGKPSPSYFAAALDALDAEPELTWLVTDDVEADVRGARLFGMKTALVRTGKFRPDTLETADPAPDIVVSSIAQFPELLEEDLTGGWTP
jgi:HAD superfamily hydrolase (TIGR01458 family)